jgi:hypothetical protein
LSLPLALSLADVVLDSRRDWRRLVRRHAVFYVSAALYVAAKAYVLSYLFPGAAPRPGMEGRYQTAYGLTFDVTEVVRHLGQYLRYSVSLLYGDEHPNLFGIVAPTEGSYALWLGVSVLVLAAVTSTYVVARPQASWPLRVAAFGLGLYVIALLPVAMLRAHLFSFYIGIAALGTALTLVAIVGLLPRGADAARVALGTVVLAGQVLWSGPLVRQERFPTMFRALTDEAVQWLYTIDDAVKAGPIDEVVVPIEGTTVNLFERCDAQRLFLCASYPVRLVEDVEQVAAAPRRIILRETKKLPESLTGSWDWLERACAINQSGAGRQ